MSWSRPPPGFVALAVVAMGVGTIVHWVHEGQKQERRTMREAVYRDIEKLGR